MVDYEVKDIDKYFSFEILRRGYDYYKKGNVKDITRDKNKFYAKVNGTEQYNVEISFDKKGYNLKCTCPYAEESNCKHMASVLYCIKNNTVPIRENNVDIKSEEISNFTQFKKQYKKECHKLFHNRYYLHENELEDYVNIVNSFIDEGTKYIANDTNLAYEIFEYFLMEVDSIDVYDTYGAKEELFANLFESFKELFKNERIFVKLLAFIGTVYTMNSDEYYFEHKENMLNLLYCYIECDWQAKDTLILLNKLDRNKNIYDYKHQIFKEKIVYINYYFIDKGKGLELAEQWLDINEICDFLLKIYQNNEDKKIELLEKMIFANKGYSNEKYYKLLKDIYKRKSKEKYQDLLVRQFNDHKNIEYYREIKEIYSQDEWNKIKHQYIDNVDSSRLYIEICVEEELYDELIKKLENEWIETVNQYLDLLIKNRSHEALDLYKNKLISEINHASSRQHYQKILNYFNKILNVPNGKETLKSIISYAKENFKNKKALQEEIVFYEETYL